MEYRDILIKRIESELRKWKGMESDFHEMGGREFLLDCHGKLCEIGHIHWFHDLDILFNKAIRDELIAAGKVGMHKWVPDSGWVSFQISNSVESIQSAVNLLRLSYLFQLKRKHAIEEWRIDLSSELEKLEFGTKVNQLI